MNIGATPMPRRHVPRVTDHVQLSNSYRFRNALVSSAKAMQCWISDVIQVVGAKSQANLQEIEEMSLVST